MTDTLLNAEPKEATERSFGLLLTAIFLIAAYLLRHHPGVSVVCAISAVGFIAATFLQPMLLRGPKKLWLKLALALQKITSPITLFALYIIIIVPFGLVMQIFRDPMRKRMKHAETFWVLRDDDGVPDMSEPF